MPIPFDTIPSDISQSLKEFHILNGVTARPRLNEKHLRLYGHHLCPFVQRAMLALAAKGAEYQFVGVDLTHKNPWHININNGLVPFLEIPDGEIITESLNISDWIHDNSQQGVDLYPGDESNRQKFKETIAEISDKTSYFIMYAIKKEMRENDGNEKYLETLEWVNDKLPDSDTHIYLHEQEHETMADLMILPFIHCAFLYKGTQLKAKLYDSIDFDKIKKLKKWYDTLFARYEKALAEDKAFDSWLNKSIEADGPKVQLFYPLY